mgnify:CR=1
MKKTILTKELNKAFTYKAMSEGILADLVKRIAEEKGFKNYHLFDAVWATGGKTIVHFNTDCELSDMDICYMYTHTKQEIIERLSKSAFLNETKEKLMEEQL